MKKIIDILKRNKLIILILFIAIIAFSAIIILLQTNNDIIKTVRSMLREGITEDNIICSVYDNTNNTIKALVTVQRVEGIDSIEYLDNQEENIKLDCNGKKKVSIDVVVELNKQYNFKVTSNGEEITETILLDERYIDEYIKISDLENETSSYKKVGIEYNNNLSEITKQYKLGNAAWAGYTSEFEMSPENLVLKDIIDNKATLYARQVDTAGNIIITEGKEYSGFDINYIEKFDVFKDVSKMGATVQDYGFTASWNNSENTTFTIGNFSAAHSSGSGYYSGTFKLNTPLFKNIRAQELHVGNMLMANAGYAHASATVYYTDGTSKNVQTSQIKSDDYKLYPLTIALDDKEISYIELTLSGRDADQYRSGAYINDIYFTGVTINSIQKAAIEVKNIIDKGFTIVVKNNYEERNITEYKYYIEGSVISEGTTDKEFKVRGLIPETTYSNIYVEAYTEDQKSTSKAISVTTVPTFKIGTTHTATTLTYTWDELGKVAKVISDNDDKITRDAAEVQIVADEKAYKVGVGDTLNVTYGSTAKKVRLIGFNHDILTDSSAYGGTNTYAGISFEFMNSLMNTTVNNGNNPSVGWGAWKLRTTLNNSSINSLSNANQIKEVKKSYREYQSSVTTSSNDKLWLLSCSEIWNNGRNAGWYGYSPVKEGEQYKFYKNINPTYNKGNSNLSRGVYSWSLRSLYANNSGTFCTVANNYCSNGSNNTSCGVVPGFAI